ncbi:23S rRNA (uracil(1939)-C(5))-methyltransferase RlmD [soil metagenome]
MKKGDEITVTGIEISTEGKGIAKTDEGFVIFVEGLLPGDNGIAKIHKKKSNYAEAKLIKLEVASPYRVDPLCPYFGTCGGCKRQDLQYEKQLEFKKDVVMNAFKRIGKFGELEIPQVIGSDSIFFYRNKMEFSFSDDKWMMAHEVDKIKENFAVGLHIPKFHSKILDIEVCYLQSEISYKILNFSRDFFKSRNISVYSTNTHSGFLRFLIVRQSANTKDLMINLITYDYNEELMKEYSESLLQCFPEITTFLNSTSIKKAQIAVGEEEHILHGSGFMHEKLIDSSGKEFIFKISPQSFFQTNTLQAQKLYDVTAEFGDFVPTDRVLDLYCGTGSISIFVSGKVEKVKGVELVVDSISNARENAGLNNAGNTEFVVADIKEYIDQNERELLLNNSKFIGTELESISRNAFNKVILDPPRAGLHPDISEILSETHFDVIVYVSCNPVTQARDLDIICSKGKYRIEKIQPVDMFPHTYHIENVVKLVRVN